MHPSIYTAPLPARNLYPNASTYRMGIKPNSITNFGPSQSHPNQIYDPPRGSSIDLQFGTTIHFSQPPTRNKTSRCFRDKPKAYYAIPNCSLICGSVSLSPPPRLRSGRPRSRLTPTSALSMASTIAPRQVKNKALNNQPNLANEKNHEQHFEKSAKLGKPKKIQSKILKHHRNLASNKRITNKLSNIKQICFLKAKNEQKST